jgi:hypothetical protein
MVIVLEVVKLYLMMLVIPYVLNIKKHGMNTKTPIIKNTSVIVVVNAIEHLLLNHCVVPVTTKKTLIFNNIRELFQNIERTHKMAKISIFTAHDLHLTEKLKGME